MNLALLFVGFFYFLCMTAVLASSWRNSVTAAPLIFFFEHFSVIGLGLAPVLIGAGLIDVVLVTDYLSLNGNFDAFTYLHIIGLGIGSLTGYFLSAKSSKAISGKLVSTASRILINQKIVFWWLLGLMFVFYILFISIAGFDTAISSASAARSGHIEQMGDGADWAFLKRLMYCGIFLAIFLPYLLARRGGMIAVIAFTLFGLALYSITVARVAFLQTLGMCVLFYLCIHKAKIKNFLVIVLILPGFYFILFYGKEFMGALSVYLFKGGELSLVSSVERTGDFESAFFGNFVHLLVSIDSGVRYFREYGSLLPLDTIVSPLSILPSRIYTFLGIEFINYNFVDFSHRMPCINSDMIFGSSVSQCSIPPYMHGYSAYLMPVLGGVFLGHIRFLIYAILQNSWNLTKNDFRHLWLPMLFSYLSLNALSMIPAVVSLQFFVLLLTFLLIILRASFLVKKKAA